MNDTLGGGTVMDGRVGGGFGGVNDGRSANESRDLGQALALVDQDEQREVHPLVFVQDLPGTKVCCGVVSSGQGVKRFCLHALIKGRTGAEPEPTVPRRLLRPFLGMSRWESVETCGPVCWIRGSPRMRG
jgi:hypothetical protein